MHVGENGSDTRLADGYRQPVTVRKLGFEASRLPPIPKPWIEVKGWLAVNSKVAQIVRGLGLNVIFHSCLIGPTGGQSYCPVWQRAAWPAGRQNI